MTSLAIAVPRFQRYINLSKLSCSGEDTILSALIITKWRARNGPHAFRQRRFVVEARVVSTMNLALVAASSFMYLSTLQLEYRSDINVVDMSQSHHPLSTRFL